MLIASDTQFLFYCETHERELEGTPQFKHPNSKALAVWQFDLSEMECPTAPHSQTNCRTSFMCRA